MAERWARGRIVARREVLGYSPIVEHYDTAWAGRTWLEAPVYVVEDAELLVTYMATGAELRFPDGEWPTVDGRHPWDGRGGSWYGHGCLMVHDPGEHHAVWHFWTGPEREFLCWYINLQTAYRRDAGGMETQDLEADLVVFPDGSWQLKDVELLDQRMAEGRYSPELVDWIHREVERLSDRLTAGERWWDDAWASWEPPAGWVDPRLPG